MKGSPLWDPEYRRDVFIVLGLFALGLILSVAVGLIAFWLLQQLGWLDMPLNIDFDLRHSDRDFATEG